MSCFILEEFKEMYISRDNEFAEKRTITLKEVTVKILCLGCRSKQQLLSRLK